MNTSLLLGACVALFTATSTVRADLNPDDLSGRYRCQGQGYQGEVTIRKVGQAYDLSWALDAVTHTGVGIREGAVLAATYTNGGAAGIVVYRIERDRLVGKYAPQGGSGELQEESLVPAGAPPLEASAIYAVGTRVAAKWNGDSVYLATVTSRDRAGYHVLYDDNDQADVTAADLLPIAAPDQIMVGSHVFACWQSAKMYPGVVTEMKGHGVMVKWEDGSAPSEVAKEKIALQPDPFVAYPIGARVAAKWHGTSVYLATVKSRHGATYHVLYDDNDQEDVTAADLFPIAQPARIVIGSHVLACWQGARMYAGVVTETNDHSVIVKWEDGSTPSEVAKEKIALLPAGAQ